MAGQTTWNKATVPAGTDPWSAVPDIKKGLDTAGLVFSVASQAERNGLAALAPGGVLPIPTLVFRTDLGLYESWDGTNWGSLKSVTPYARMGRTAGVLAIGATLTRVAMSAAQTLRGGFTFDAANSALVIPKTGDYRVTVNGYATSSNNYTLHTRAFKNDVTIDIGVRQYKGDSTDASANSTGLFLLTAGDKINLYAQGFGTNAASAATTGNNAYDGAYLELEFIGPNVSY